MDRLTSLTVFVRVVDTGGFAAAARRLSMSTTMVSNHVQALEDRLGVRLLHRTTRRLSLTEAGKGYYERCTQILAELEEADQTAGAMHSMPRGTLRLYAGTHIIRLVAPVVADYLALYPEVSIDLTIGERMVDIVEEGFDLAIRPTPPPDSSLIVRRLASWRHVLCCAPAYLERHTAPKRPEDLVRHNCLRYALYPFGDEWRFVGPRGRAERGPGQGEPAHQQRRGAPPRGPERPGPVPRADLHRGRGSRGRTSRQRPRRVPARSSSPSTPSTRTATNSRPRCGASSTLLRSASSSSSAG